MRTWRVVNLPPSLNHVLGGVAPRAYPAPPRGRTISTRVSLVSGPRPTRPSSNGFLPTLFVGGLTADPAIPLVPAYARSDSFGINK
ncbi:hypothetical protein BHE74_00041466 [Ensete ventricosum]|nr:hypothetical protein GW17_00000576 [Ensete ventricosum]RWW52131.1 hypothetical protein BHE74_00041466 [Ensete ventricosum]RZS01366.1 hypothetical protein BHM03_00031210 [Ensete ventricosum]